MNTNRIMISLLAAALSLSSITCEAAAKKAAGKTKAKKQTAEKVEKNNKKRVIVTSEAFYDKIWQKFKVGSKADRADVITTLKKIIKQTPDEFMAYYYLGVMNAEEGEDAQALKNFEIALSGFPKSADIHIRMARLLEGKGKDDDALSHYRQALAMEPDNAKALSKCGIAEYEKKNFEKAAEYLTKARAQEPDNSDTLRALGQIWVEQGNYAEAIEILEQVLLFDAKDAQAHLALGRAYEKSGNHEKAAEHIEFAGKYGKKDASITEAIGYDIARNLSKTGKFEEAISAYKKEIKKNDNPAQGYFEMGETFEQLEQTNNAIKAYQKAYELDKKLASGIYRCAELYQQNGDKENMQKMLKLLKSNSEYKDRAEGMIDEFKKEEELNAEHELQDKLTSRGTKDAELEAAYLESYDADKKNADILEKIYLFYKERGYYDDAIKWYRKYAKVASVSDYDKKSTEKDLKAYLEQDNYYLFGDKSEDKPSKSKTPDDELMNLAFNGENDRQQEVAFQVLLSRKEYKEDRKVIEGALKFYEERGRVKEATKYINQLKKLGYLSESEASYKKEKLKE